MVKIYLAMWQGGVRERGAREGRSVGVVVRTTPRVAHRNFLDFYHLSHKSSGSRVVKLNVKVSPITHSYWDG